MMMPPSFSLLLLRPSSGFQVPALSSQLHHHSTSSTRPINRSWMIPRIMRLKVEDDDDDDQEEDTREEPSSRSRPTPSKFTGAGGSSPLFSQDSAKMEPFLKEFVRIIWQDPTRRRCACSIDRPRFACRRIRRDPFS